MDCLYPELGTRRAYAKGCKCAVCQAANTERARAYRRKIGTPRLTQVDDDGKLLSYLYKRVESGCWVWQGKPNQNGYGRIRVSGVDWLAHRYMYYQETGEIPDVVMHTCDNPPCVNMEHLRGGTQQENIADMRAKRRQAVFIPMLGEDHGMAILTNEKVLEIRNRVKDERQIDLAKEYGVKKSTIFNIVHRVSWKHI